MAEESPTDKVINRLYNCKFRTAYEQAKEIKGFPKDALKTLKKASIDFENCGWGGARITNTAEKICNMLGYTYDEDEDYYLKEGEKEEIVKERKRKKAEEKRKQKFLKKHPLVPKEIVKRNLKWAEEAKKSFLKELKETKKERKKLVIEDLLNLKPGRR